MNVEAVRAIVLLVELLEKEMADADDETWRELSALRWTLRRAARSLCPQLGGIPYHKGERGMAMLKEHDDA